VGVVTKKNLSIFQKCGRGEKCGRGSFVRFVNKLVWSTNLRCVFVSKICMLNLNLLDFDLDQEYIYFIYEEYIYFISRIYILYIVYIYTLYGRNTLYSRKRFLYIVGNASIWLETLPSYRKRFLLPATYLSTSLVYPWAETLPSACWKRFLLPVDRKRFLLPVTCFSTNSITFFTLRVTGTFILQVTGININSQKSTCHQCLFNFFFRINSQCH